MYVISIKIIKSNYSTISANLNSLSGIVYKDYIATNRNFKHTEKKANLIMKGIIVLVGIYCVLMGLVVEHVKSIFQVLNTVFGLTQGAVFGVFALGMLYPRANGKAAFWSTIFSMGILSWIIIGSQVYQSKGLLNYRPLPSTTDGCDVRNITVWNNTSLP